MGRKQDDNYDADEIARRRDEVVRRMANTPPQPRKKPIRRQGKKKQSASDRVPLKNARDIGDTET